MKLLVTLLMALFCSAQTVSFAPQGAEALRALAGKKLKGFGLTHVIVCSSSGLPIQAGLVYQTAVRAGSAPISPSNARSVINRAVGFNWWVLLNATITGASIGIPALRESGAITISSPKMLALLGTHVAIDAVTGQIRSHVPDPSALFAALLDPNATITFPGFVAGCQESAMAVRWTGEKNAVRGVYVIQ